MHLPNKQSDLMTDLAGKLRSLADLLCDQLAPTADIFSISESSDLFAELPPTQFLRIIEGQVEYSIKGKLVMCFEEGDLLGLPRTLNLPQGQYSCNQSIRVEPFERDGLLAHANSELKLQRTWAHFLLCNASFHEQALAQELRTEFQPAAGFLHFSTGEVIIKQGDIADRVYTLLEGSANAECDGIKVGEIHANEIFGALAVFTRQERIASVVATSDCTVLAVRKEEFIELIDHQPQICLGLIEEMASKINQLNNQLLQHKSSTPA
jgi:CRP/FNR family transcriptional regulator, cyclic AMP receptor protein